MNFFEVVIKLWFKVHFVNGWLGTPLLTLITFKLGISQVSWLDFSSFRSLDEKWQEIVHCTGTGGFWFLHNVDTDHIIDNVHSSKKWLSFSWLTLISPGFHNRLPHSKLNASPEKQKVKLQTLLVGQDRFNPPKCGIYALITLIWEPSDPPCSQTASRPHECILPGETVEPHQSELIS